MNDKEKEEYTAYLQSRKSGTKVNYYKESLKEIDQWKQNHPESRPSILLHACCVVCACWPLDFLHDHGFQITIMYNNSNIWPKAEHDHRLQELKRYLDERWHNEIGLIEEPYDYGRYADNVLVHRGTDPEGWKSCFACYAERMDAAFAYADRNGFDYFTTVMTFSRQKDSQKINQIGIHLGRQYRTKYFVSDFKKADGALKSAAICDDYCLYRQDYCGCAFSYYERHPDAVRK